MRSEYLRPLFATPQQAVDFVDRGRTATGHHGKQTLRASGLDESQETARSKLRGMNPVAIQEGRFNKIVRFTRIQGIAPLILSNVLLGSGEDPNIDRSTWPESPVMVSNTDAVIESFWDFKLGYTSRWSWTADADNALVRQKRGTGFN